MRLSALHAAFHLDYRNQFCLLSSIVAPILVAVGTQDILCVMISGVYP